MTIHALIHSTGAYLPEKILTNRELEKMVDTSDEWITQRSGIKERRIAAEDQTTSDMAIEAARQALSNGKLAPADIDCIIVATTTPDQTFPAVAVKVQAALGIPPGPAFDVQAVCTGFIYAISVANSFIRSGQARRVLVIGAEKMSTIVNWKDRTTCVLFADGAGAIVLSASDITAPETEARGVYSTHIYADGTLRDLLYTADATDEYPRGHIVMEGREVFKYAVELMADIVVEALGKNNMKPEDIDWLVPHQANLRIIEGTAKKLKLPMEKVIVTVDRHGNTSAASIPLALHEGVSTGRINRGDLLLLEALGGGLTWGAALARF
ncbi:MAG: beta-ketoacyl-ACP synthase III [Alphaproteobacteria bacterium]